MPKCVSGRRESGSQESTRYFWIIIMHDACFRPFEHYIKNQDWHQQKQSIFLGASFPADVGEFRGPSGTGFFLKLDLGPSWARLNFYQKSMDVWDLRGWRIHLFFPARSTSSKSGILKVDRSKPITKLAQDGNDEQFTKKGVLDKKCCSRRESGLGPLYFFFEKSWEPKLGLRRILEKDEFLLAAKMFR